VCSENSLRTFKIDDKSKLMLSNAGCPRWSSYVNQNALSAVRYAQYNSPVDCRDFCSRVLQCVAVDYDYNTDTCWLHFDVTNLLPVNIYHLSNVTQFVIDRSCAANDSTTTTTTTTTSTSSTNTSTTSSSSTTGTTM